MAKRPAALGKIKKPKQSGNVKFIKDWIIDPTSPVDIGLTLAGGKAIKVAAKVGSRAIGGIAKAGSRYVEKIYRNIG